jgi:AAA domain/CHC2 zinc finger
MSSGNGIDIEALKAAVPLRGLVERHRVELKRSGRNWKGLCPFHAEDTPSFIVYEDGSAQDQHFHCFGCQARGDVIDFLRLAEKLSFPEARDRLAQEAGQVIRQKAPPRRAPGTRQRAATPEGGETWDPIVPPPHDALKPDLAGCISYEYVGPDGKLWFYQRRFEKPEGKKFGQLTFGVLNGKRGWHSRGPAQPYPLYRLDQLTNADPETTVTVVEGEKAVHAAERLFPDYIVTTWLNGAGSVSHTDWSPLRRFKRVIWWADADKPRKDGKPHGCFLATPAFLKLFPGAEVLDTTGLPDLQDGFDAADLEDSKCDDPEAWLAARLKPAPPDPDILPSTSFAAITPVLSMNDFVEGLFCSTSFVVVYGEPGSGKSFWVLDVCLHVASGRAWNDRAADRGLVIYAALEGGAGIRNRIVAARNRLGLPSDTALELIQLPLDLRNPDGDVAKFIATINALQRRYNLPLRAVVIDTLSRAMAGGNENSPEDMGALVMNSDRVRIETGACIIFIHHSGKDAARGARGHSLLRAAADTEIEITRHENRVSVARVAKQREIEDDASFAFSLESVTLGKNHRGKPVTSCVVLPAEMPETAADGDGVKRGRPSRQSEGKATYAWKLRGILADLILTTGRKGTIGVPPGFDAVTRDSVREAFFDRTTADPEDRSTFTRALNALEQSGVIAVAKGHVWMTGKGADATK